jgi:nitrogen regulatory protein PII
MNVKLVLIVAPELEEDLVDVLLGLPAIDGFTASVVAGNGKQQNMSLAEQVTGRRKRLRFELVVAEVMLSEVLDELRQRVEGDTVYWVEPLLDFGKLRSTPSR